jgi:hypothetical protein
MAYPLSTTTVLTLPHGTHVPPYGPAFLSNNKVHLISVSVAGTGAVLNLLVYGSRTRQAMIARAEQDQNDSCYCTIQGHEHNLFRLFPFSHSTDMSRRWHPVHSRANIRDDQLYHKQILWDQLTVRFQMRLMPQYLPFTPLRLAVNSKRRGRVWSTVSLALDTRLRISLWERCLFPGT